MRRLLVLVLVMLMVLAMVPTVAMAETTVTTVEQLKSALGTSGDIVLGADIDAGDIAKGSFFTVPSGVTVTLDLNGHILQGTRTDKGNTQLIENKGTLTIKDSKSGGKLLIDSTTDDDWNSYCTVIANYGTMNVESGTLLNTGSTDMSYAIDNNSNIGDAVLTVSGGMIRSDNYIAIRQFANSTTFKNIVTVKGGTIYGAVRGIWLQQTSVANKLASLIIEGGTVEGGMAAVDAYLMGTDGVDITITGGVLINHSDTSATLRLRYDSSSAGGANLLINGGQFSNTGTGGNIGEDSTGNPPSVIKVYMGTFNAPVPPRYIPADADMDKIVVADDTLVTASVDPTFTIVIPAAVNLGTLQKDVAVLPQTFEVEAKNVIIETGKSIVVSVASDFRLSTSGGATLGYVLRNSTSEVGDKGIFATFTADRVESGSVRVPDTSGISVAGVYQDTMTFTIAYQ
ncbi:MAG: hypothetical protein ACOX8N_01705 [Christensenellales bacterium]